MSRAGRGPWLLVVAALGAAIVLVAAWGRGSVTDARAASALARVALAGTGDANRGQAWTGKAGVASGHYLTSDPARLTAIGASWAYDWSAQPPPSRAGERLWVPMVWGAGSVTPAVLAELRRDAREKRARYLLGFNEPDNGGQANMTPQQAAALWPSLERTGLVLGSPAPAVPEDGWLRTFMHIARARHLRVDFIAVHYYQDFTDPAAVSTLRRQLIELHRQFGRPIWVTEIGAVDIRTFGSPMEHPPTEAASVSYLHTLFAMLDALPFVQRYAWFTDQCWNDTACHTSSLYDGAGRLTAVGRAFRIGASGST